MPADLGPPCDEPRVFTKLAIRPGNEPDIRKSIDTLSDATLDAAGITASHLHLLGTRAIVFFEGADDPWRGLTEDADGAKWLKSLEQHSYLGEARRSPLAREILHRGQHGKRPAAAPFRGGLALTVLEGAQQPFRTLMETFPDDFFEAAGITGHSLWLGGIHDHDATLLVEATGPDWLDRLFEAPRAGRKFEALGQVTDFDVADPGRRRLTDVRDLMRVREYANAMSGAQ